MLIKNNEMKTEIRNKMRGGDGGIKLKHYVSADKIPNGRLMADITIPVDCSIGTHEHKSETEYYIILSGIGEVNEDGKIYSVSAGDVVVTHDATHGIKNSGKTDLRMIAVIING